jgi:hypothetical protein
MTAILKTVLCATILCCMLGSGEAFWGHLLRRAAKGAARGIIHEFFTAEPQEEDVAELSFSSGISEKEGAYFTGGLVDQNACYTPCYAELFRSIMNKTYGPVSDYVGGNEKTDAAKQTELEGSAKAVYRAIFTYQSGPIFDGLCDAAKAAFDCAEKCPASNKRDIAKINFDFRPLFCEAGGFSSAAEFFKAAKCLDDVPSSVQENCKAKCGGGPSDVANATGLKLSFENGNTVLSFEPDAKKNGAAITASCKTLSCILDCSKADVTNSCGAKTFDLAQQAAKRDQEQSLRVLKVVNAVDPATTCL